MRQAYSPRRLALVTLLCISCGAPQSPAPPTPTTQAPVQPPVQSSTQAPVAEGNITIDQIEIANPIVVSGRARTFENAVSLRVRDAHGAVITESFTTSTGEMGQHNPYRGTLWIPRDPGGRVTVEALEYSAKDGSEQSLVSESRAYDVPLIEVRLYLPDANCTRVRPVTRRIPKSIAMARLLVEALIAEPHGPFPKDSRVKSVNLRDDVITVDFNERLQNVGGSCAAQMIGESVTKTLEELPMHRKIVITAGGSEKLALQP